MQLDGLSLSALVAELHTALSGGRIDRIFQVDSYSLLLWIRSGNRDFPLWLSAAPSAPDLYIMAKTPENPATPPALCMLLRKHLEDGRLISVEQQGLDRIVNLNISVRGEGGRIVSKTLICEFMGKHSNIILVQDGQIIDSVKRVNFQLSRYRQILPGRPYLPPPGQERLPAAQTEWAEIEASLKGKSALPLGKALLQSVNGLGPVSIREIIWRAGLPQNMTIEKLESSDWLALKDSWQELFAALAASDYKPSVAVSDSGNFLALACFSLHHLTDATLHEFPTLSEAADFSRSLNPAPRRAAKQDELLQQISEPLQRARNKYPILEQELAAAEDCDKLRICGDILMSYPHLVTQGASEAVLPDIYSEAEDATLKISLHPLKSAVDNAQLYYARYNKSKRAQELLRHQLENCRLDITYLESVLQAAEQAETSADFEEIRLELIAQGYLKAGGKKKQNIPQAKPLSLALPGGSTLLIGRNNRQNDLVTFKLSQTNDLWFHTKDIPGSHVILHSNSKTHQDEDIRLAALFAAYFSKSRDSSNVPVDYTLRRHVKKPSGAKPGFVIYEQQQTLYVTPEHEVIKAYLK